jgi:large subunit ribosomal protein L20
MGNSTLFRTAKEALYKAWSYAYVSRRLRKRDFRSLWILRLNAALEQMGLGYAKFMGAVKKANIGVNRKMLSELAVNYPAIFKNTVDSVK